MRQILNLLLVFVVFMGFGIYADAQDNPKLDAHWKVIRGENVSNSGNSTTLTMRLQIRCSSPGLHKLNSGDFYIEYDSTYMLFSHNAEAGIDYLWAPAFDPKTNPLYKYSKVVDFGTNPFDNSGNNLMDVSIIDTSHSQGTLLDSGVWTDVVDLTWHIEKPGFSTEIIWFMTKEGRVLTNVYESFEDMPKNFDSGDGWAEPFIVRLE